jgi:hypothetical protein
MARFGLIYKLPTKQGKEGKKAMKWREALKEKFGTAKPKKNSSASTNNITQGEER